MISKDICAILAKNSFGTLMINGLKGVPEIVSIPFFVSDDAEFIEFHIAISNAIEPSLKHGKNAKLLVQLAHGYISSSVYDHENVPTYNYSDIQICGTILRLNEEESSEHLRKLVAHFEKDRNPALNYDEFSKKLIDDHLPHLAAMKMEVYDVQYRRKLSQNRDDKNYKLILDDLKSQGNLNDLYDDMKKMRNL